tara:strand:- start:181 stop:666 length:486 start_codon:yes stop_codon:yes gene_type:complete
MIKAHERGQLIAFTSAVIMSTSCGNYDQFVYPGTMIFVVTDVDVISYEEPSGLEIQPVQIRIMDELGEVHGFELSAAVEVDATSGCFADCSCTHGSAYSPYSGGDQPWGDFDFAVFNEELIYESGSFTLSKDSCESLLITSDNVQPKDTYEGVLEPWLLEE